MATNKNRSLKLGAVLYSHQQRTINLQPLFYFTDLHHFLTLQ